MLHLHSQGTNICLDTLDKRRGFHYLEKNLQFSYSIKPDLFGNAEKFSFIGIANGYARNWEAVTPLTGPW